MDIRSEKDQHFEINFPKKADEFFGHMAVLGPTGSGKGWWITDLIKRMWQNTTFLQRRKVYYISAEATIDKTLDRIRIRKYADWFFPIDVSFEAGEASGMSPPEFWAERVSGQLSEVRNADFTECCCLSKVEPGQPTTCIRKRCLCFHNQVTDVNSALGISLYYVAVNI